jgi:hypothetical protein
MNKKRFIAEIVCGAVLLFGGASVGYAYANRNLGVQGELRDARNKLNHYLVNEAMAQSEMTTLSEFQLHLAQMELYHVRYTIWNQENYESIEAEFQKDEQRWEEDLKKEQEKLSEFECGSMAPMDHNMRMTAFVEKRINELKLKWIKK